MPTDDPLFLIKRTFIRHTIKGQTNVLLNSLYLIRKRARVRTRGVWHELEPYFGRLALALWSAGFAELRRWENQLRSRDSGHLAPTIPTTYAQWDKPLIGSNDRFSFAFLFDVLCSSTENAGISPWATMGDRAAREVAGLAQKMYRAPDPRNYAGKDNPKDEVLRGVLDLLNRFATRLQVDRATEICIGSARLGKALVTLQADNKGKRSCDTKKLIPVDYVSRGENTEESRIEEFKKKISDCKAFDANSAAVFDPYGEEYKWRFVGNGGGAGDWVAKPPDSTRSSLVVISEVFHEIPSYQLHAFLQAVNAVTKPGGACLVQDMFFLPASIEKDFCLYRCDEIATLFQAFGWKTLDAPRWSTHSATPYGLVLAIKPAEGAVARDTILGVNAAIHLIRHRLIKRIEWLLNQWHWRRLQANEIREHFYSVYSLSNLIRWEEKPVAESDQRSKS